MANKKQETVNFEAGLTRLDEIIRALEQENVPLGRLMELYEEGVGLLRRCNDALDHAEQKVKMLRVTPDGARAYLEPFDEQDEQPAAPTRPARRAAKGATKLQETADTAPDTESVE